MWVDMLQAQCLLGNEWSAFSKNIQKRDGSKLNVK